jgi:alcohol dehydrogenase class IV
MNFEFATAARVRFGPGVLREVPDLVRTLGHRVLLVTGRATDRVVPFAQKLEAAGLAPYLFPIRGEPTTDDVLLGVRTAREGGAEVVISYGGGSAIDAGKAIAALLTNPGDLFDYLEVIGHAHPLTRPAAPFIAIPTTAGTGTEVTRNAVLASLAHRLKVSLRSPFLLPHLAVVDPELTYDLSPAVTAATGLDALTQLIEPFVSCRANPLTDGFCREGLRRVARALPIAWRLASGRGKAHRNSEPGTRNSESNRSLGTAATTGEGAKELRAARADLSLASLLSGLALANAGLGAVHGFAAPIGGMFAAPHGAVCAVLLPHVMKANIRALRQRAPDSEPLHRYEEIARLLTAREHATAGDGVVWVHDLVRELRVPSLGAQGVTEPHVDELVQKAIQASSMKGNPVVLTAEELAEALRSAL